jgi:hypothetical protein
MCIQNILRERQIRYLCHFTRLENLESILNHGLIPRANLYNKEFNDKRNLSIHGIFNDEHRYDGKPEAICLSISFPNSSMFYGLRCADNRTKWAVIVLSADVLIDKNCAFYPTNAANNCVRHLPTANFQGVDALNALFEGADEEREFLLPKDPTDVQAEVLVFDEIERKYILGCVFDSDNLKDEFIKKFPNYKFKSNQNRWGVFDNRFRARKNGFNGY